MVWLLMKIFGHVRGNIKRRQADRAYRLQFVTSK